MENGNVLFSTASRPVLGPTQPPIQWVPEAPSAGVKRSNREAHHSNAISAEVKNAGAIPSLAIGTNLPIYTWLWSYRSGVITLEPVPEGLIRSTTRMRHSTHTIVSTTLHVRYSSALYVILLSVSISCLFPFSICRSNNEHPMKL
jgi:hypothetical protein